MISLLNPHSDPERWLLLLSLLYRWEIEGQRRTQGSRWQLGDSEPRLSGLGTLLINARIAANMAKDPPAGSEDCAQWGDHCHLLSSYPTDAWLRPHSDFQSSESWRAGSVLQRAPDGKLAGLQEGVSLGTPYDWTLQANLDSGISRVKMRRNWIQRFCFSRLKQTNKLL